MTTAAQISGEATFQLDGQTYRLTLNNMALIEAEGALGESMLDWVPQLQATIASGGNPQIRHLAAILFGGLKVNHSAITQEQVVDLAMRKDAGLLEAMLSAMEGIEIPDDPEGNEPTPAPKKSRGKKGGTGKPSSGSGAKRASRRKTSG